MALVVTVLSLLFAVGVVFAVVAIPAFILMVLLGVLASLTGWACAIGFLPCFVITLILAIFA